MRAVGVPVGVFLLGALVAPGLWWAALVLAVGLAVAVSAGRGRWPARGSPRKRAERRRWLIVHAELLAACLDSGLAMATALRAVGDVLGDQAAAGLPGSDGAGSPGVDRAPAVRLMR